MLFVAAILAILIGIGIPGVLASLSRSRGHAAVRYLATRMAAARLLAVNRSAVVALRFESGPRGTSFVVIEDGDRDGVRTSDIDAQTDRVVEAPVLLSDLFPGVEIGVVPQMGATSAVQLGGTTILSFSPSGTASSGTIHVRDHAGTQWAVRVLGATARTRVLRFEPTTSAWVNAD
jgi:Tfp pilus assembly protein FimT